MDRGIVDAARRAVEREQKEQRIVALLKRLERTCNVEGLPLRFVTWMKGVMKIEERFNVGLQFHYSIVYGKNTRESRRFFLQRIHHI